MSERPPGGAAGSGQGVWKASALVLDQLLSWPAIPVFDDVPFGSISDLIAWFEKLTGASRPKAGRQGIRLVGALPLNFQCRTESRLCPVYRGDDYKVSSIDCTETRT